jgi:hypothetical protein
VIRLWLDDIRPAPPGWTWVATVEDAKALLVLGVDKASLDHDLGDACDKCWLNPNSEDAPVRSPACSAAELCRCACHLDGSALVRWMAETGCWPKEKPSVHSANPDGAEYMRGLIECYWAPPGERK